jgi:hypothetical protein
LRIRQRHLKFACQFVQTHLTSLEINSPGNDVGIFDFKRLEPPSPAASMAR